MTVLFVLLALLAIGVIAVLVAGKIGQLEDPVIDRYRPEIPLAPLSVTDVESFRFATAVRGYRMEDVDEALGRLTETLRIREAQLAALNPQLVNSESTPAESAISAENPEPTQAAAAQR